MQARQAGSDCGSDREIVIIRTLDAPAHLVWRAWTDPDQVVRWWGPNGFSTTTHSMEVRAGGVWRFDMHGPDGRDYPNRIHFIEVVEPERLVYSHAGEDDVEPVEFTTTVNFEKQGDRTKLTLRMVFSSTEARDRVEREYGAVEGGIQTVGRLAEHLARRTGHGRGTMTIALPSSREIIIRRTFDAPRDIVFEAMTRPEHVRRWWGPRSHELVHCEMDFREGGAWRFVQRDPDGQEHPFKGVYKEIVAPERVVQTFIYDVDFIRDFPAVETVTLEDSEGHTIYTNRVLHATAEARDGHLQSGMETGAAESLDRLADLVASMSDSAGAKR